MLRHVAADAFAGLEPAGFWAHFAALTRIPRPSHEEEQVAAHVAAWAGAHGFATRRDDAGNLVVAVPATRGREAAGTVILQGHLDMVCEREPGSPYDPREGRIHVVRDGDWLVAEGTTLGADDGVAIAAMLALAEAGDDAPHGPLELLMTVAEEVGLSGAQALDPALVTGDVLLNLDSEEDGTLTIGCAGSEDHVIMLAAPRAPLPPGAEGLRVTVSGGRGGHSGGDIAAGRANAITLLAHALRGAGEVRIASLDGGASRNAIPRDAVAVVAGDGVRAAVAAAEAAARRTYARTDPGVRIDVGPPEPDDAAWSAAVSARVLDLLALLPAGPLAMSPDFPGLVETSSSVGVARTAPDGTLTVRCLSRSSDDDALPVVRGRIEAAARLAGAAHESLGSYPGVAARSGRRAARHRDARVRRAVRRRARGRRDPRRARDRADRRAAPRAPDALLRPGDRGAARARRAPPRPLGRPLHAAAARAAGRAVALTKARKIPAWRSSSFQLSCSSHCTPSTHASPATSIASITPSSARPAASTPSPSRSMAWWCHEFTRCGPGPSAASSREPGATRSSWSGWPGCSLAVSTDSRTSAQRSQSPPGCSPASACIVPPRATLMTCIPRQTPSTGLPEASAASTSPNSNASRASDTFVSVGCAASPP